MAGKRVVILGGGIGGLVAAREVRRRLGREHQVTVVDRSQHHVFQPSLLWVLMGWRQPQAIQRPLSRLHRRGIAFLHATVEGIVPDQSQVRAGGQAIPYDYLVIALGAELAPEALPGFAAAHSAYDLESALKLRDFLPRFSGGRVTVLISSTPFKCPAAPYEIAFLLEHYFRKRGRPGSIDIYTPEPLPMPSAGPAVGQALKGMLESRGIGFHPNLKATGVDRDKKEIVFESGTGAIFDVLLAVPPHRSPRVAKEAGLAGETGWIPVDAQTLQTNRENIYALGDIAAIKLPSGAMLPKAGVFAHGQAEVVAQNIAAAINGAPQRQAFSGKGYCFVELGGGRAGFASGDFYRSPSPLVQMRRPGPHWHWGKVLLEKYWFWRYL